eukprot:CAMPEP_0180664862 /NCGR_PEP_ID=MMETSP1037_2-20121125/60931_1 /TAXON_ID=632150 /ORGANISM="Azadinium spinosum, Strain 3D9" /LENGTH=94 /DNA_ID=CAMNT_0022693179 /DNA_START=395 /DNA_END=675 /DNA_ORIENTATION=+
MHVESLPPPKPPGGGAPPGGTHMTSERIALDPALLMPCRTDPPGTADDSTINGALASRKEKCIAATWAKGLQAATMPCFLQGIDTIMVPHRRVL